MQNFGVGMIGEVVYGLWKMCDIGYDNGYVGVWYYLLNRTADVEKVFLPTKYILNSQYSVENTNTILYYHSTTRIIHLFMILSNKKYNDVQIGT